MPHSAKTSTSPKAPLVHAQVLVLQGAKQLTHFGRHQRKLDLVSDSISEVVTEDTATAHAVVRAVHCQHQGNLHHDQSSPPSLWLDD